MSFEENQAAAFQFEFRQAGSIKKGDYCLLNNQPCKISDLAISKPGKHGSAKVLFTGINIFTDKKIQEIYSTSSTVKVPIVKKYELQVVDIAKDDYVSFILPNTTLKQDLKLPTDKDQKRKLREIFEQNKDEVSVFFTIIEACGIEKIISSRAAKN